MLDVNEIRMALDDLSDGRRSARVSISETGSPRPRLGIRLGVLREYVADYNVRHKADLTLEAIIPLFGALYGGESIEETIFAGLLLARLPTIRQTLPLDTFGGWLGELTGWLEVDATCQSTFTAKDLYGRWDEWAAFLRTLHTDAVIARRRASLVLPIRTVRESDDPRAITLALELATALAPERDKLITKAISWLLREAVKRHRAAVVDFLEAHAATLHSSIIREVQTKLTTGKKNPR